MRKLLFAIVFAFIASPAFAQNTTCATRPPNDNSNACASTAFVQAHPVAPGSLTLPSGQIIVGNGSNVGQARALTGDCSITNTGVITCTPGNFVWIKNYGALCDGSHDDTTAIQNAWNAAAPLGVNVYLSGVSTTANCKITTLTMPTPPGGNTGPISMLVGDGPNSVTLTSTATTGCAITIAATYGVNSDLREGPKGFTLAQSGATQLADGLCVTEITNFNLTGLNITGFHRCVNFTDSIRIHIHYNIFSACVQEILGTYSTHSHPNAWSIHDNTFSFATQYGVFLENPAVVSIYDNTFEAMGTNSGLAPATVYIFGNPIEGYKGASVYNNYFENNAGIADVLFDQNGQVYSGAHEVRGNTFNRVDNANVVNEIKIIDTGTGSAKTSVTIDTNGFLGGASYTPDSGRQLITVSTRASYAKYSIYCPNNTGNTFTVEMTDIACQPNSVNGTSGWSIIPGGYTQWGVISAIVAGTAVTFPIACPNEVNQVILGAQNGSAAIAVSAGDLTTTGFTAYSASGTVGASYTAICH